MVDSMPFIHYYSRMRTVAAVCSFLAHNIVLTFRDELESGGIPDANIPPHQRLISTPTLVHPYLNTDNGSFSFTYLVYRDAYKYGFVSAQNGFNLIICGRNT